MVIRAGTGMSQESEPLLLDLLPVRRWGGRRRFYDTLNRPVCVITFGQSGDPGPTTVPIFGDRYHGRDASIPTAATAHRDRSPIRLVFRAPRAWTGWGEMTGVLENGIGASTAYGYDVQGNLISVLQGSRLPKLWLHVARAIVFGDQSGKRNNGLRTYFDSGNLQKEDGCARDHDRRWRMTG